MERKAQAYAKQVLAHLDADAATRVRLERELEARMDQMTRQGGMGEALHRMGPPREMAQILADELNAENQDAVRVRAPAKESSSRSNGYEYVSAASFGNVPLVHINITLNRGNVRPRVAKGVIAIGDVAIGGIAVGAIAVGLVSIGAVGLGAVTLAAVALGLFAAGAVAVGVVALGAIAAGVYAWGAVAAASRVAFGAFASGPIAVTFLDEGGWIAKIGELAIPNAPPEQIWEAIIKAYPGIEKYASWIYDWVIKR